MCISKGARGAILDANGNLLANSLSVRIVTADATITTPLAAAIAEKLPLLKTDVESLSEKLSGQSHYVRLNPRVKLDEEHRPANPQHEIEGNFLRGSVCAVVSQPASLASHVIGFVNADHKGVQGIRSVHG